jgi:hypothetical protein
MSWSQVSAFKNRIVCRMNEGFAYDMEANYFLTVDVVWLSVQL